MESVSGYNVFDCYYRLWKRCLYYQWLFLHRVKCTFVDGSRFRETPDVAHVSSLLSARDQMEVNYLGSDDELQVFTSKAKSSSPLGQCTQ